MAFPRPSEHIQSTVLLRTCGISATLCLNYARKHIKHITEYITFAFCYLDPKRQEPKRQLQSGGGGASAARRLRYTLENVCKRCTRSWHRGKRMHHTLSPRVPTGNINPYDAKHAFVIPYGRDEGPNTPHPQSQCTGNNLRRRYKSHI